MSRNSPFSISARKPVQFGNTQIRIVIEVDERGLMRTAINKPLPAVQILGLLLDSMQGQYQAMAQQASLLLINTEKEIIPTEGNNAGEKEKDDNNSGGNSSRGIPIT